MKSIWTFAGAAVGLAVILCSPAVANDTVAERAAGGLVFTQNDDIDMVSEDLYVSAERIRVRYVFRNRSPRDVKVTVAFPLPDRDLLDDGVVEISYPTDFRTTIDGKPIVAKLEQKAMIGNRDYTMLLQQLGIPLMHGAGERGASPEDRLETLPKADRDRLVRLGIVIPEERENGKPPYLIPAWTVTETWYREQLFPAGRDVHVEHVYRPGSGGTSTSAVADPGYLRSDDGRRMIADYCIDAPFLAGARRMAGDGEEKRLIGEEWVSYILTTGANWRSPIGDFRLVVDKGSPRNLVSFCGEGIKKIGPTQFEMRRRNWRPDKDLKVLILVPAYPE